MSNAKTSKEPLIHITKRKEMGWQNAWLIRIASIAAALIVCALVTMATTGQDPLNIFGAILEGAFGTQRKI